jgi:hypothetical protein
LPSGTQQNFGILDLCMKRLGEDWHVHYQRPVNTDKLRD